MDILLDTSHDLLQDVFYESMLRWCFSGLFIFALAGPPCGDFSRAKLRPGGPKPLRNPEFPFGVPRLSDRDQQRVESSRTLLHRVVQILLAVFGAGGHVCLEQPSSASSWQDPSVQDSLAETAAVCSVVPACCFGLSIHKKWLFASSLQDMSQLAGECNHASWEHENLVNLPCIQMGYVRQLFRLFGPCFRVVNLLWTLQWHISTIVFPRKGLQILPIPFRMGLVFTQCRIGRFRHQLLSLCQAVYVDPCFSGSVSAVFPSDFSITFDLARTRSFFQQTRWESFGPSLLLGFSPPLVLLLWTGQCLRGSHIVCMLCSA